MSLLADSFYDAIPPFEGFSGILDDSLYHPVPDDWQLGLSDVVRSTAAIEGGGYKRVNTAGAAVIAAVRNALPGTGFPFVFGGDGASFAVPAAAAAPAREALSRTAAWVRDDLGLELRTAMVPVAAIRQAGHDLRVARFAASPHVSYAMFAGGGLGWAEAAMKAGAMLLDPAAPGEKPDLAGLSCRWGEIPSRRGLVLSLIAVPQPGASRAASGAVLRDVIAMAGETAVSGTPLPEEGPPVTWPPDGLELEALAARPAGGALWRTKARLLARTFLAALIFRSGLKAGGFDPARYISETVANTDFRKYDDGLRMTLDCTPALAAALEEMLEGAARRGLLRYGLHRQQAARITCVVRSALESDHLHFIDGAEGGYAAAAARMKAARPL